jgi:hypothetical protein
VLAEHDAADYAEQLVSLASLVRAANVAPYLAMANGSDLSARVSALLDEAQHRGRAGTVRVATAMAAVTLVVAAVAPLRAVVVPRAESSPSAQSAVSLAAGLPWAVRAIDRALVEAAHEADLQGVTDLMAAGADVNAVVLGDGSPLIAAARTKLSIVRLLLDRGANPNLTVPGDGSPLIQAAAHGAADIVALLIEHGADVNLAVRGDENPLMNAARAGSLDVVKLLVERGARVNERIWADRSGPDRQGEWRTALSQARRGGHSSIVEYLQSVGARE